MPNHEGMTKYKRRREPSAFRPLSIRASSFRAHRPAYQPCPGLATGGRVLRKSACWRCASFSWSASRACCSGLGPELQPSNIRNNTGTKGKSITTFFIGTFNHSQSNERGKLGNVSPTTESRFRSSLLIARLFTRRQLQAVALERFEAFDNFIQREFVPKIDLIIDLGAEPVLVRLPILRHQDDRRLQHGDHVDRGTQQEIGVWIKPV